MRPRFILELRQETDGTWAWHLWDPRGRPWNRGRGFATQGLAEQAAIVEEGGYATEARIVVRSSD